MLQIAIVEDDRDCALQLQNYIRRYADENGLTIETTLFSDGADIIEHYRSLWDIILMDVEMPHVDGLTAAKQIRQLDDTVVIMFITNMAQYAIRGYEVSAIDYVLKPLNYYAFSMKLRRACAVAERTASATLLLTVDGEVRKFSANDLRYVEVADHQLIYHMVDGDRVSFGTLKKVEAQLGEYFVRCNHCYLVNLRFVDGIQDDCLMVGKELLRISRPKKKNVLQKLLQYYQQGGM